MVLTRSASKRSATQKIASSVRSPLSEVTNKLAREVIDKSTGKKKLSSSSWEEDADREVMPRTNLAVTFSNSDEIFRVVDSVSDCPMAAREDCETDTATPPSNLPTSADADCMLNDQAIGEKNDTSAVVSAAKDLISMTTNLAKCDLQMHETVPEASPVAEVGNGFFGFTPIPLLFERIESNGENGEYVSTIEVQSTLTLPTMNAFPTEETNATDLQASVDCTASATPARAEILTTEQVHITNFSAPFTFLSALSTETMGAVCESGERRNTHFALPSTVDGLGIQSVQERLTENCSDITYVSSPCTFRDQAKIVNNDAENAKERTMEDSPTDLASRRDMHVIMDDGEREDGSEAVKFVGSVPSTAREIVESKQISETQQRATTEDINVGNAEVEAGTEGVEAVTEEVDAESEEIEARREEVDASREGVEAGREDVDTSREEVNAGPEEANEGTEEDISTWEMDRSMETDEITQFLSTPMSKQSVPIDEEAASGYATEVSADDRFMSRTPQAWEENVATEQTTELSSMDRLPFSVLPVTPETTIAATNVAEEMETEEQRMDTKGFCSAISNVDPSDRQVDAYHNDVITSENTYVGSSNTTPSEALNTENFVVDECMARKSVTPVQTSLGSVSLDAVERSGETTEGEVALDKSGSTPNVSTPAVKTMAFSTPRRQSPVATFELIGNEAADEWQGDHLRFDVLGHSKVKIVPSRRIFDKSDLNNHAEVSPPRRLEFSSRLSEGLEEELVRSEDASADVETTASKVQGTTAREVPEWCGSHIRFDKEFSDEDEEEQDAEDKSDAATEESIDGREDRTDELDSMDVSMSQMKITPLPSPKPARYHAWEVKAKSRKMRG